MNILLGVIVMIFCLVLQAGLAGAAIIFYDKRRAAILEGPVTSGLIVIVGVMMLLLLGIFAQIGLWAALFQMLGEFELFEAAFYHSAVNFATLGYGDIVMSEEHRLLGPLEAVNGVVMIGVSTAVIIAALQDALAERRDL